jgi:hypothetical protein
MKWGFRIIQFTALSLAILLGSVSAFAEDVSRDPSAIEEMDLRPTWMENQYILSPNASVLFMNHDPGFYGTDYTAKYFGKKNMDSYTQQYQDRTRDYDMRATYGLNTTVDQQTYTNDISALAKSMAFSAKNTYSGIYGKGFAQGEKNGDVDQTIVTAGGVGAIVSGATIPFKLGGDSKGTWSGDAINQRGQLNVMSPVVNARVDICVKNPSADASQPLSPDAALERYKVSLSKPLPFELNSAFTYGSTSNSYQASLSRQIYDHISGGVGATRPAGDNYSGAPSEETVNLSYGIRF